MFASDTMIIKHVHNYIKEFLFLLHWLKRPVHVLKTASFFHTHINRGWWVKYSSVWWVHHRIRCSSKWSGVHRWHPLYQSVQTPIWPNKSTYNSIKIRHLCSTISLCDLQDGWLQKYVFTELLIMFVMAVYIKQIKIMIIIKYKK